jgi:hypothetical protein
MADARGRAEWARTSQLGTLIVNVNRDPKSNQLPPDYFSPYREKLKPIKDTKAAFQAMKDCFVKKKAEKK